MVKNQNQANFIIWTIIFHVQGVKKSKKIFLGPFDQIGPQIWAKRSFWVKTFKKMKNFQKIIFFDLNNSESKKGIEFLSLFVSVRLCIFFGHRSSRCMLILSYSFFLSFFLSFYLSIFLSFFLSFIFLLLFFLS